MAWIDVEGWRAGRAWKSKSGRLSFYIRRNGRDHATGASTLPGALAALERFEKTGEPQRTESPPVLLDVVLAREFLDASKAKGNSHTWRVNQRQHLDWWQTKIGGRDLRAGRRGAVTVVDIETALDGAPSRRQRIAVIKSLYAHLRRTHRIATTEDPTWGQLAVPPARPAQDTMDKTIDPADVRTTIGYLDAEWMKRGATEEERNRRGRRWGDLLRLFDGCGIHVTEAARFAKDGTVEALPGGRKATKREAAVLAIPLHKTGQPFKVVVSRETLQAAERVRAAGPFSIAIFYGVLRKAAEKTGATVLPGRFRHSIARFAVEHGASVEAVAAYHKHKDKRTTARYYAGLAVAPKIPTPR